MKSKKVTAKILVAVNNLREKYIESSVSEERESGGEEIQVSASTKFQSFVRDVALNSESGHHRKEGERNITCYIGRDLINT
jgi:hypothetical protein